jgi:hypothetical protein
VAGRAERGQVLPFVAALIALVGLLAAGVAHEAERAIGRARAQAAADAAALAGASQGRGQADELAKANGSTLVSYVEVGAAGVRVEVVDKGGEHAEAQAVAHASSPADTVAPAMRAVLARAAQVLGTVVSPVAADPDGLSVQLAPEVAAAAVERGAEAGLCPTADRPQWFEICPP